MSSPITVSDLVFLHPTDVASLLSDPASASKITIIDVRDSDHIGGHIKGSQWVPTSQLDTKMPELLRQNKDKDKIIFHCMLSQQRGPQSALKFARSKWAQDNKEAKEKNREGAGTKSEEVGTGPQVCVLEGGFGSWQARYGEDEKLTEGYVRDIWE